MVTEALKLKDSCSLERKMTSLDSVLKTINITLLTKICIVKDTDFPVVMCGCGSWTIKKAEHRKTVVLEKTLKSPLESKETKPVNLKENQP